MHTVSHYNTQYYCFMISTLLLFSFLCTPLFAYYMLLRSIYNFELYQNYNRRYFLQVCINRVPTTFSNPIRQTPIIAF